MTVLKRLVENRLWLVWIIIVVLLAAGGAGYFLWQGQQKAALAKNTPTYETTRVRRGNVLLTASGTGKSLAVNQIDLSFPISGTIAQLNVQPGDRVSTGDLLAVLDGIDTLKLTVQTRQLELQTAQTALDNLTTDSSKSLAQAKLTYADAQAAYNDAQNAVRLKGVPRCDQNTTENYYYDYIITQKNVNQWESYLADRNTGYGTDYINKQLIPLRKKMTLDYNNWQYCQGYTPQEIQGSHANLKDAEAKMNQAQADYEKIQQANGIDPKALALAEASVKSAQLQLEVAQNQLNGATMIAPMDGIVISVAAAQGDQVATSEFITLADLDHPGVQVNMDESDLKNFKVGCPANVTFDSIPNRVFPGSVTQVSPALVTVSGYASVQGMVELQNSTSVGQKVLPLGLSASVDVICEKATNVLIAPLAALHTDSSQPYVYVLNAQGKPEKHNVELGLEDFNFAEIRSGLVEGDQVITKGI
jgi:RND family efflux transporter MFP subunit